jgi:hypothetical protein
VLSAAIGASTLSLLAIAADKSAPIRLHLNFYAPTGPLSGVTSVTILVWLLAWSILGWCWRGRNLALGRICLIALALLVLSLLLTFPPVADIF